MKITAMVFAILLFWGLKDVRAEETIQITSAETEIIAQELEKEAESGQHDSKTRAFLKKVSEAFKNVKNEIEVEVGEMKQDCANCTRQEKAKSILTKIGQKLGKGAAWVTTKTAKPFMTASAFVKGAVEKSDKNQDVAALLAFLLNHQEEFDELYLEAGTPEEMIELMLVTMEDIMQKKAGIILKDFLAHIGIKREIPEDLSKFELTTEEIESIDLSKLDVSFINNHPEFQEVKPLVGAMTQDELTDLVTAGYFNKAISFENVKETLPSIPELVGTVVGQMFVPKIALGIISKSLAGLYATPVFVANVGTAVSTAVCLDKGTQAKFSQDKDLKMFCSYVTNKSGYELLKGRAKGYVAGKKFHEKMKEKIQRFKEKREERKRRKEEEKQREQLQLS